MNDTLRELVEQEDDTQKGKYLTFNIEKESYGIEIKYVTEIISIQDITEVPEVPEYVKGIINLRGKIIPVMDVRLRFKKPSKEYNERTCTIIIEYESISFGLIVDNVAEVVSIADENIIPPPDLKELADNKYVSKIGKVGEEIKLLLDCGMLLSGGGD